MKRILLSFSLLGSIFSYSQTNFSLHLKPTVESQNFDLNQTLTNKNGVKFSVQHFDYYLSHLHVIHDGGQDLDLSDTVFIVKYDDNILDLGNLNITEVESVKFGVGVPIELSHTDIAAYPENHPLSFQEPSMQWGWSAGYIHMIVGGLADGDNNDVPEAYFEIHSLGDGNYYEIEVPVNAITESDNSKSINLTCNLDEWLGLADLAAVGIQHGENGVNYNVMKNVILRPVFTADATASVQQVNEKNGEVLFYKNEAGNFLKWNQLLDLNAIQVLDVSGKIVFEKASSNPSSELNIGTLKNGTYFVRFFDKNNTVINSLKFVN